MPVLVWLGFAILAFALLARFGPLWPAIALFSLFYPALPALVLAGGAVALALSRSARRGWQAWFLLLLSALLLADALHGTLWPRLPAPQASQRPIRIVEFNAWLLNRDPVGASRWILAQRPDVVVLLEASGEGALIANALAAELPYRFTCTGGPRCSTIILSREEPAEVMPLTRGDPENRRALSALLVRFDGYAVAAVHLSRPSSAAKQLGEIEQLIGLLGPAAQDGLVLTGDFNSPLWSRPMRRLMAGLALQPIAPDMPSWPAPPAGEAIPPIVPIDHALLGPGWAAASMRRGPEIGSDHYPAMIELVRSERHDR